MNLGDYTNLKNTFFNDYSKTNPFTGNTGNFSQAQMEEMGNATNESRQQFADQDAYSQDVMNKWRGTMTPQQLAEYDSLKDADYAKKQKMGQMAFLAAAGAMAAPGILGALGGTSSSAGAGAGMADWMAGMPAWGGAEAGAGAMGSFIPGVDSAGMGALGSWSGGIPSGVDLGSLGGVMSTGGGGGGIMDMLSKYGPEVLKMFGGGGSGGSGGGSNLLTNSGLGLTALSAIMGLRNNQKLPGIPDYTKLAEQTADSRLYNQANAQGDTSSWAKDPNGRWTQSVNLSAPNQQRMLEQQQMAAALRGNIMNTQKNPPTLPAMDNFSWGG
jgi:hypothetical protein